MKPEITDEQIAELCMFMRVLELMKQNPKALENPEMKRGYDELCSRVDKVIELLSPEELDIVLKTHKMQLQQIKEEEGKKKNKE